VITGGNVVNAENYFWQGDRVRLRPLSASDAELAYEDSLDSSSRQLLELGIELPSSIKKKSSDLEAYADFKNAAGPLVFAIENLDGETAGFASLHSRHAKNGTFSFGVSISRQHRQKGFAEDTVRILLKYAFHERRFQKCNSSCVEGNEGSVRLHNKLGFREEGRRRRQWFMNGRYYDDLLFGLTREEFDASIG